jgi:general secretion pathway protein G
LREVRHSGAASASVAGDIGSRLVREAGLTLIELVIGLAIVGTLATMARTRYLTVIERARVVRSIADLKNISTLIRDYQGATGRFPDSLADVDTVALLDPWGNPYQYLNLTGKVPIGNARKDKFLVPINSTYDLYSMGPDGESQPPLTAKASRDDIIRANDGGYLGRASQY